MRSFVKTIVRASLRLNKFLTKSFLPGFATSLLLVVLSGVSGAQADTGYARPVLVEGDPSDLEPSEMREREHLGQKTIIAKLRECRDSVAAGKPLPMLPARPSRPPRTCAQQFFRGLPEAAWSPSLNATLLELEQSKVAMYDAYISEMEQLPTDEEYLQQHRQSLGSRPIRVLSSGAHRVGSVRTLTSEELKYEHEVALAQGKWLQLSSNAKLVVADHSSEYIQFD
jgi:hypothetical protein